MYEFHGQNARQFDSRVVFRSSVPKIRVMIINFKRYKQILYSIVLHSVLLYLRRRLFILFFTVYFILAAIRCNELT